MIERALKFSVRGSRFDRRISIFDLRLTILTAVLAFLVVPAFGALPTLSINDVAQSEGSSWSPAFTTFTFTVTLSAASASNVSLFYQTVAGTASDGTPPGPYPADYNKVSPHVLTFAPGETQKTIDVQVWSDFRGEPDETFTVVLSGAAPDADMAKDTGVGTIVNDDPPPDPTDLGTAVIDVDQPTHVVGDTAYLTYWITNNGPADAAEVSWTVDRDWVNVTPSQGQCSHVAGGEGGAWICRLGALASGASTTVVAAIHVETVNVCDSYPPHVVVSSASNDDPDTSNNTVAEPLATYFRGLPVVTPPSLDLPVGGSAPVTVYVGERSDRYTLYLSTDSPCVSVPASVDLEFRFPGPPYGYYGTIPVTAVVGPCTTQVHFTLHESCTDTTFSVPVHVLSQTDAPPLLSSVTPATGTTTGGTLVRLGGSRFRDDCWAYFDGRAAHGVTFESAASLVAASPQHAAGPVTVSVHCSGSTDTSLSNAFTYLAGDDPAPLITSITPSSAAPGQAVTIHGANFRPSDPITFGSAPAASLETAPDAHVVVVPSLPPGSVTVHVKDVSGPLFTVLDGSIQITHVAPLQAPVGAELTIDGSGFRSPFSFTIGGQTARLVAMSFERAVVRIPSLPPGTYELAVRNGAGQVASGGSIVVTSSGLMITSAAPLCARSDGGAVVTIAGSGFNPGATVTIDGVAAPSVTVADSSHLTVTLPSLGPTRATIIVRNPTGESATATNAVAVYSPLDPDGCPVSSRVRAIRP